MLITKDSYTVLPGDTVWYISPSRQPDTPDRVLPLGADVSSDKWFVSQCYFDRSAAYDAAIAAYTERAKEYIAYLINHVDTLSRERDRYAAKES